MLIDPITPQEIKRWRDDAGFDQMRASKFLCMTRTNYNRIERGLAAPSPRVKRVIDQWYAIEALKKRLQERLAYVP